MDLTPKDDELLTLESADDVADFTQRVYGSSLSDRGLLHATSLRLGQRGRHRIQPLNSHGGSKCLHANLARQLTRARADAIFTTRDILAREPELDHRLSGPGRWPEALANWRSEHLAKSTPPITLVLSPDPDLDLDHRVFTIGRDRSSSPLGKLIGSSKAGLPTMASRLLASTSRRLQAASSFCAMPSEQPPSLSRPR